MGTTPPPPPTTTPPPPPTTTPPPPPTTIPPPPPTSEGRGCSSGIVVSGQCLFISTEELSWEDAKKKCASQGSALASIDDPQAFHDYLNIHHKGVRFWLGGSDSASEGNWAWINGRQFGDDFPWGANEPNNYGGNQHCLVAGHASGVYDDLGCDHKTRFVCNLGCTSGVLMNGQCLTLSQESLSWDDARAKCSTNNGALASLNDPQAFHDYINRNHNNEKFWLGGTDSASEGNWVWLDGRPFGNFPWPSNEPNNVGGNQHCLKAGWNGNWDDGTCSDVHRFVCNQGCAKGTLVLGQCLSFSTEKLPWIDAKARCESQNGALVSLVDPQGFQDYTNTHFNGENFWLGGTDSASEGNWAWLDGRPFGDNFPWGANEPNNWGGNQHCLVGGHASGVYDDGTCSGSRRFVCTVDNN